MSYLSLKSSPQTDALRLKQRITCSALAILALLAMSGLSHAHDGKIPLGDGKISSSAKVGYLFSCQQSFNSRVGKVRSLGNWIDSEYWYPALKPTVDGAVKWTGGGAFVSVSNGARTITSKNLPTHTTGVYPIQRSDDAYKYDPNPNAITAQNVNLKLPATPQIAASPSCVPQGMIGVSLTGAAIFNAIDSRGYDAPAHEIQDECGGHPQRRGQYHYHGPSTCMVEKGKSANGHSGLVGYAIDGFGIYGLKGAGGKALENSDLDACHGHTGIVMWDGKSTNMYHYHLTSEFPYTVSCLRGTPTTAHRAGMQQPGTEAGRPRGPIRHGAAGRGPRAALSKAAQSLGVSVQALRQAVGSPPPNFRRAARVLGIPAQKIRAAMRAARR